MRRPGQRNRDHGRRIPARRRHLGLGEEQGAAEVRTAQVGAPEIGAQQVRAPEVGAAQVGADEVRAPQARPAQRGTPQVGADQVRVPPVDPALRPAGPHLLAHPLQQHPDLLPVRGDVEGGQLGGPEVGELPGVREGVRLDGAPAQLTGAQYGSGQDGPIVTIVETAWIDQAARGGVSTLDTLADAALALPASGVADAPVD